MSENDDYVLEIHDLTVEYRTPEGVVKALNGLEIELERGQALGLVGETGAGKTTMGLSVLGLVPNPPGVIVSGSIRLNGDELLKKTEVEMERIRGKYISMIFQDPMTALNPVFRVEDQIAESTQLHEHLSSVHALKRARQMMELVGIPSERGNEYPYQFSGGMKQRVVIAIALACNPSVLIADEPTTALDVTIQAQVLDMMKSLREQYQTSLLMITHDLGVVADMCNDVSVIYSGMIIEHGTVRDIFKNTRHPYTEGLLNSLPELHDRKTRLKPIKGLMPDPVNLPSGCPFYPRCNYAMPICQTERPGKMYRTSKHYVRCHLYGENGASQGRLERR